MMDTITIPIPDGISEERKAEIAAWLEHQVQLVTPERLPCEDDPEWHAEAVRKIKQGMADIKAGRVYTSDEVRGHLRAILDEPR